MDLSRPGLGLWLGLGFELGLKLELGLGLALVTIAVINICREQHNNKSSYCEATFSNSKPNQLENFIKLQLLKTN